MVQCGESGVVLEPIALNVSDSIVVQLSEEPNENISLQSSLIIHLLQFSKMREILERIRFNGGDLVIVQTSTDMMRGWRYRGDVSRAGKGLDLKMNRWVMAMVNMTIVIVKVIAATDGDGHSGKGWCCSCDVLHDKAVLHRCDGVREVLKQSGIQRWQDER